MTINESSNGSMPAVIETVVMVGRNIGNQADFYLFASDVLCRQGSSHDAGHQKVWVKHDRTSENKKKSMNFSVISVELALTSIENDAPPLAASLVPFLTKP